MKSSATESLSCYEIKQLKPWCNEKCSKLLDGRKQTKLQWLQNLSQSNGDDLKKNYMKQWKLQEKSEGIFGRKFKERESNNKN
jgi:hypothetical protein